MYADDMRRRLHLEDVDVDAQEPPDDHARPV